ncbi:MAG TPA: NADH-quinone oxidoreductase subunit NuoK [Firmicutes bacterium]|nr:NADH-quinone oxidoreductase subunit NuoK [Bacillota bacterium]
MITLQHYLGLGAVLFAIGLFGTLSKRNVIGILMGVELMLNAANLNLVAFARFVTPLEITGQAFALFTIVIAAAEVAVGLAIAILLFRRRGTVNADDWNLLRW